ncbi:MAG: hypothetical protein KTR26_08700 [Flammeovirgaceae bacterium]|nr:hypothetical protein [Flammeovirgaceae bacterium]
MSFASVKVINYKEVLHPPLADLAGKRSKMTLKKESGENKRKLSFSPKQKLKALTKSRKQETPLIFFVFSLAAIIFLLSLI